jgi:hypothetical protein
MIACERAPASDVSRADLSRRECPREAVRTGAGKRVAESALVGAKDVIVSDLALTEMASALGRRTREGCLTLTESRRLYREAEKLAGVVQACGADAFHSSTHRTFSVVVAEGPASSPRRAAPR